MVRGMQRVVAAQTGAVCTGAGPEKIVALLAGWPWHCRCSLSGTFCLSTLPNLHDGLAVEQGSVFLTGHSKPLRG